MKHPASTATILLLGLAFVVGGAGWLLSGAESDGGHPAQVPVTASSDEVGFVGVTPKEQHKKMDLERTEREFKRIREIGEEVQPDLYMIPDASGDPTYYMTKLIKGTGRNGEPLFVTAQMKKLPTGPMYDIDKIKLPESPKFKKKALKGAIKGPKAGDHNNPGPGAEGTDGGAGQPSDGSGMIMGTGQGPGQKGG